MTPIWRGEVEMRWDDERLMLGRICVGRVWFWVNHWFAQPEFEDMDTEHPTEAEARSSLVNAAVRALGGGDG